MVDKRLGIAVVLALLLMAGMLADHLHLLGAGGRVWRICLFWAAVGAMLLLSIDLMQFGFADALSPATLVTIAPGAVGGAVAGGMMSCLERRWPR